MSNLTTWRVEFLSDAGGPTRRDIKATSTPHMSDGYFVFWDNGLRLIVRADLVASVERLDT